MKKKKEEQTPKHLTDYGIKEECANCGEKRSYRRKICLRCGEIDLTPHPYEYPAKL